MCTGIRYASQGKHNETLTTHQRIPLNGYIIVNQKILFNILCKITKYNRQHRELNHITEDNQSMTLPTGPNCSMYAVW